MKFFETSSWYVHGVWSQVSIKYFICKIEADIKLQTFFCCVILSRFSLLDQVTFSVYAEQLHRILFQLSCLKSKFRVMPPSMCMMFCIIKIFIWSKKIHTDQDSRKEDALEILSQIGEVKAQLNRFVFLMKQCFTCVKQSKDTIAKCVEE